MTKDDAKRIRQLEEENRSLKKLVADLALDNSILEEVPRQKVVNPDQLDKPRKAVVMLGFAQGND